MEELPSISYYVWHSPDTSVAVHISLEVIERIRALLARNSADAGGVLRGAVLPSGAGTVVVVDDFEAAVGKSRLAARAALPSVVGRWRVHTGGTLAPVDSDRSEMALYFPQPWKVLLLVRPDTGQSATAGIFTWVNGAVESTCRHEFPFHSGALLAASAQVVEGPQRSHPVEWRSAHGWRTSTLAAIIGAIALAGGTWYWHRPDGTSRPKPMVPVAAAPVPAPPASMEATLPEMGRPSAMPRRPVPAPAPAAPLRAVRTTQPKPLRAAMQQQVRDREASVLPEPVTRHFFEPAATPPLAPAHKAAPSDQRAQDPAPPRKATVTIAEAHPVKSARSTFLPPLPVLAARPEARSGCPCDTPVDIRVHVDDTGAVTAAEPAPGTPDNDLTAAALAAAREWSFVAARDGARKVPSEVVLRFRFPNRPEQYITRK